MSSFRLTSGVLGIMYPLLMAAMLGIGDGVLNTQLNALLGILFKNDTVLIKHINNIHLMFNDISRYSYLGILNVHSKW